MLNHDQNMVAVAIIPFESGIARQKIHITYVADTMSYYIMQGRRALAEPREPALQGWGRPWVLCASAVCTAAAEANNRGNTLFWMRRGEDKLEKVWALHPTLGYPRGVCAYTTRIPRLSLRPDPGEALLATIRVCLSVVSLSVGVCVVQMVKMTTFRIIFMTFRS